MMMNTASQPWSTSSYQCYFLHKQLMMNVAFSNVSQLDKRRLLIMMMMMNRAVKVASTVIWFDLIRRRAEEKGKYLALVFWLQQLRYVEVKLGHFFGLIFLFILKIIKKLTKIRYLDLCYKIAGSPKSILRLGYVWVNKIESRY